MGYDGGSMAVSHGGSITMYITELRYKIHDFKSFTTKFKWQ